MSRELGPLSIEGIKVLQGHDFVEILRLLSHSNYYGHFLIENSE